MKYIKKGPVLQPALKESLNLLVTKGPEETTDRNEMFLKNIPERSLSGFSLFYKKVVIKKEIFFYFTKALQINAFLR